MRTDNNYGVNSQLITLFLGNNEIQEEGLETLACTCIYQGVGTFRGRKSGKQSSIIMGLKPHFSTYI